MANLYNLFDMDATSYNNYCQRVRIIEIKGGKI